MHVAFYIVLRAAINERLQTFSFLRVFFSFIVTNTAGKIYCNISNADIVYRDIIVSQISSRHSILSYPYRPIPNADVPNTGVFTPA